MVAIPTPLVRSALLGALAVSAAPCALPAQVTSTSAVTAPEIRVRPLRGCRWHPECSTPGGRLEVRELSREPFDSGTVVSYGVSASGLPAGRPVALHIWGGEQGARVTSGYLVDSTGHPACPADGARSPATPSGCIGLDSLRVRVAPLFAGSPVRRCCSRW